MTYLYIGIAGALGAITRYLFSLVFITTSGFPLATLIVNLLGTFLLAVVTTNIFKKIKISRKFAVALTTGFLGSFTTFSALSLETVTLFENGNIILSVSYILLSLIGGLLMCQLGYKTVSEVKR